MILFTDDSNLFLKGPNIEDIVTSWNTETEILIDWLQANRLSLNIQKTHYMIFSPKTRSNTPDQIIKLDNIPISRVKSCKFLGVLIEENVSWKLHINYISTKIAKSLGLLNKAHRYFQKDTLLMLYYAFIYPLLLFCNVAWGNTTQVNLWPIFKIQKYAIRLICNLKRRNKTTPYFKNLAIIRLPD